MANLRLITANIGRHQSVQHTRSDFENIRRLGGIVGFQEIDEADAPDEHALLKTVMGRSHTLCGMGHLVPIAVPKSWVVTSCRDEFGADGVAKWSPARFFTVVTVKVPQSLLDKARKRPEKIFAVINCHYPAGAYHGTRPPQAKAELRDRWDEMYKKHRELVKNYADKGITVFWTGDSNRAEMPKTHAREVQVVTAGIDNVCYVEGKVKVKPVFKGARNLYSDHPALWADFKLS